MTSIDIYHQNKLGFFFPIFFFFFHLFFFSLFIYLFLFLFYFFFWGGGEGEGVGIPNLALVLQVSKLANSSPTTLSVACMTKEELVQYSAC